MSIGEGWDVDSAAAGSSDFRWYRVSGNKGLDVVVLSERPINYVGHYDKGRMHLCVGEDCRYCAQQVGAQIRYCVAVAEVLTRRPGLLELGRTVALELRDLADKAGYLRGLRVFIGKHSHSKHSRMEVEWIEKGAENWWRTLVVPDVMRALELTWEKDGVDVSSFKAKTPAQRKGPDFKPPIRISSSG
jgi:hypothetical protein